MRIISLILATVLLLGLSNLKAQDKPSAQKAEINWMTMEEAVAATKKQPRKIIIDIYTDWCGWCKRLDAVTYTHPVIVDYINKNYYAVKLDAEMKDTVKLDDKVFVNPNPTQNRSSHQLAIALLNGKMSYPTTVFLDEAVNMLSPVAGFLPPENMEPILKFYGENAHKTTSWEEYQKTFKGQCKPQ